MNRYIVDGFVKEDDAFQSIDDKRAAAPFYVFDIEAQDNVAGPFDDCMYAIYLANRLTTLRGQYPSPSNDDLLAEVDAEDHEAQQAHEQFYSDGREA